MHTHACTCTCTHAHQHTHARTHTHTPPLPFPLPLFLWHTHILSPSSPHSHLSCFPHSSVSPLSLSPPFLSLPLPPSLSSSMWFWARVHTDSHCDRTTPEYPRQLLEVGRWCSNGLSQMKNGGSSSSSLFYIIFYPQSTSTVISGRNERRKRCPPHTHTPTPTSKINKPVNYYITSNQTVKCPNPKTHSGVLCAEVRSPLLRTQNWEMFSLAWRRSVYSLACFTHCHEFHVLPYPPPAFGWCSFSNGATD